MHKKILSLAAGYILMFFSFLGFITSCGYAFFVVDWHVSMIKVIINAALLLIAIAASICVYGLAEKIRLNA